MNLRIIAALTFLLTIGNALADDTIKGVQNKQDFMAMKTRISKEMVDGKQYGEMTPEDQKTLNAALARMDERWQKADATGALNPDDRVAMANDQEVVLAITQHAAADSRVVCHRETPVGSHLPHNECKSVAQIRRERENAQDSYQQNGGTTK